MFLVAWGFGLASLLTFFLGLLGRLQPRWLWVPLVVFSVSMASQIWLDRFRITKFFEAARTRGLARITGVFLVITGLVYSLRLIVPETAFDALWYHLTLPKLYLEAGRLRFFPGGLLYYSAMPQAMEMFYVLGLAFQGQLLARSFHFLFGVLSAGATYQLARRFVTLPWALLASLIFYTQLVVGWESAAAYVDLTRTFLETTALIAFLNWHKAREKKWLMLTGSLLGLAISVKLLGLGTGLVALALLLWLSRNKLKDALILIGLFILVSGPWLAYGRWQAGSWFYPFFEPAFQTTLTLGQGIPGWFLSRTPLALGAALWKLAFTKGDILTPVFLIGLPLVVIPGIYQKKLVRVLAVYLALYGCLWFLTPMNYNRFLLPATPGLATLVVAAAVCQKRWVRSVFLSAVFATVLLNLAVVAMLTERVARFFASGLNRQQYLDQHLAPELGNFGTAGRFLEEHQSSGKRVLVVGGHNLFYLSVPFDHESWAQPGVEYTYIVTVERDLPEKFGELPVVFEDEDYRVKVYELN